MNISLTDDQIRAKLRECRDPEVPCNIVDLGLIYNLQIKPLTTSHAAVNVTMTLTSRDCPLAQHITEQVRQKILELPAVGEAHVQLVFDPPWDSTCITEAGRRQLGLV